jgi:hypothetical protein
MHYFDICINPQKVNNLTIGNYPRKVDEYLAMGKPVVATKTAAMKMFEDYVYLGLNAMDYEALLDQAIAEDTPDRRQKNIAFAQSHTWQASVAAIYASLKSSSYRKPADNTVKC